WNIVRKCWSLRGNIVASCHEPVADGMRSAMVAWIVIVLCLFIACFAPAPSSADVSSMYSRSELDNAAPRLAAAVMKIYDLGVKPQLTPDELSRLHDFALRFPLPSPGDEVLNFYAVDSGGKPNVVMPILSLKVVEDMATAYAWLYQNGMSLGTIDLYFSMLRHKPKVDLPGGKYPPLLATLGIPANALEDQK